MAEVVHVNTMVARFDSHLRPDTHLPAKYLIAICRIEGCHRFTIRPSRIDSQKLLCLAAIALLHTTDENRAGDGRPLRSERGAFVCVISNEQWHVVLPPLGKNGPHILG